MVSESLGAPTYEVYAFQICKDNYYAGPDLDLNLEKFLIKF